VYIQPFPPAGRGKVMVSRSEALVETQQPRWNPNGRELFYVTGAVGKYTLMTVPITKATTGPTPGLEAGPPKPLFVRRINGYYPALGTSFFSVDKEGVRFLANHVDDSAPEPVINLVMNWEQALARIK
jgi:hypothetical protein